MSFLQITRTDIKKSKNNDVSDIAYLRVFCDLQVLFTTKHKQERPVFAYAPASVPY